MTTLPIEPSAWAYPASLVNKYPYNVAKAKALMVEAGYPNGFEISMLVQNIDGRSAVGQIIQDDLAKVGIKVKLDLQDNAQFFPKLIKSDFELVIHGTGDSFVDPDNYFAGASVARPFRNFYGVVGDWPWFPAYKATIEKAGLEADKVKRKELYGQLFATMTDETWTNPIAWSLYTAAFHSYVKGMDFNNSIGLFYWDNVSKEK
jgi:ABC-type transport system substrate-binding protein